VRGKSVSGHGYPARRCRNEDLVGEVDIDRVLESARSICDYVLIRLKLKSGPDL
jgi:hypothetical protein